MSMDDKIKKIKELLVLWKSGELSSVDFAFEVEKIAESKTVSF